MVRLEMTNSGHIMCVSVYLAGSQENWHTEGIRSQMEYTIMYCIRLTEIW